MRGKEITKEDIILDRHKHFIRYLKAIKLEEVGKAIDSCLKLKIITKKVGKLILKEVLNERSKSKDI